MSGSNLVPGSVGPSPLAQDQAPVTFWLEVTSILQQVFGVSYLRAKQSVELAKTTTSLASNPTTLSVALAILGATSATSAQTAAAAVVSDFFHPSIAQQQPPYSTLVGS